jgi:hypothetical protein
MFRSIFKTGQGSSQFALKTVSNPISSVHKPGTVKLPVPTKNLYRIALSDGPNPMTGKG